MPDHDALAGTLAAHDDVRSALGIAPLAWDPALAVCGHYTRVVWATTELVGCGIASCPGLAFGNSVICNYGPGGNTGGRPYEVPEPSRGSGSAVRARGARGDPGDARTPRPSRVRAFAGVIPLLVRGRRGDVSRLGERAQTE
ncbi:MAG: hypothetical protein DCC71_04625 [Proteobacteria bacterium]|nr:MAG: hypothetical protein DCC71_04625 [Pseudomonadota bacterium]